MAAGLDAAGAPPVESRVAEAFDYIAAADGSGRRYLGETAIDDSTMAFGSIPPEWKDSRAVRRVEPMDAQDRRTTPEIVNPNRPGYFPLFAAS